MKYIILFIFVISLTSCLCQSTPDKDDYIFRECYVAMDCMYRMKKDHDKTICRPLVDSCSDALKEHRSIKRLSYCKDFKPADMTERECRMWLNQK